MSTVFVATCNNKWTALAARWLSGKNNFTTFQQISEEFDIVFLKEIYEPKTDAVAVTSGSKPQLISSN